MDRISQVSLNTMRLLTDNQKITASNLANLNTIGFRRDVNTNIGSAYLQDPKAYEDRVFASRGDTGVDTSVSNLISTDRPLDIAITGWVPTFQMSAYVRALPAPGALQVLHRAHLVHGERISRVQQAGVAVALAGVVLVSAG